MPEVTLDVGGRSFQVVCEAGEEAHLEKAAAVLNVEASTIEGSLGRIPEARMLLLSGLMLADRLGELENSVKLRDQRIENLQSQMRAVEEKAAKITSNALHLEDAQVLTEIKKAQTEADVVKQALLKVTVQMEKFAAELAG